MTIVCAARIRRREMRQIQWGARHDPRNLFSTSKSTQKTLSRKMPIPVSAWSFTVRPTLLAKIRTPVLSSTGRSGLSRHLRSRGSQPRSQSHLLMQERGVVVSSDTLVSPWNSFSMYGAHLELPSQLLYMQARVLH